jgi:G3E family GTPase
VIGGFLGAGKTTAILRLAERLRTCGQRVGLITNDQSYGLVDTGMLAAHQFPVEEITGGCFCCRFNSLVEASTRLSQSARPEVFLAEPVGSCTDLKATVDYPLRRMYGDAWEIAPFCVLVDPIRAERILGLATGKNFSEKVRYIYDKQLEEAEIIVINKIDLLDPARLERLREALQQQYPNARVHAISARQGRGIDDWLAMLKSATPRLTGAMDVDYDTYADGEALLGWVNGTWNVRPHVGSKALQCLEHNRGTEVPHYEQATWDGNATLLALAQSLHERLAAEGIEVAHLKMTLTPSEGNDLAVVNLVRTDFAPEASHALQEPLEEGELVVNLRAEADPQILRDILLSTIDALAAAAKLEFSPQHVEAFRPGRPTPTHRLTAI